MDVLLVLTFGFLLLPSHWDHLNVPIASSETSEDMASRDLMA